MGLEFIGNPYENEYEDDSDLEIERDEEWVVPVDLTLQANRPFNIVNYWSVSDDASGSLEGDAADDEDFTPDSFWDEEEGEDDHDDDDAEDISNYSIDDVDNNGINDEIDNEDIDGQNLDEESYPEYDEIEDVFVAHSTEGYGVDEENVFLDDDDDDDIDYVTYPLDSPIPEQLGKIVNKSNDANNLNSNNPETTTNSSAELNDD